MKVTTEPVQDTPKDLKARARALICELESPEFKGSFVRCLYEEAALASYNGTDKPSWLQEFQEDFFNKITEEQNPDGSWSNHKKSEFVPDKVVTTLAVLNSLDNQTSKLNHARSSAWRFLNDTVPRILQVSAHKKTFAFEAILAKKLSTAITTSKSAPSQEVLYATSLLKKETERIFKKKISKLYRKNSTIHSLLDALPSPQKIDWERVQPFQEDNGSMGIYPSSTLEFLTHTKGKTRPRLSAFRYVQEVLQKNDNHLVQFYPSENFERYWSYYALVSSPLGDLLKDNQNFRIPSPTKGLSVSKYFSLPDVDTSAMKDYVALRAGAQTELEFIDHFYADGTLYCYEDENRVSPSANIHVLMAMIELDRRTNGRYLSLQRHKQQFHTVLEYLSEIIKKYGFIEDKWHISDLYPVSHGLELFSKLSNLHSIESKYTSLIATSMSKLQSWLLDKRKPQGWGVHTEPTIEETSYAIMGLLQTKDGSKKLGQTFIGNIRQFLLMAPIESDPPLWIGKTTYKSNSIPEALRLSALALIHKHNS
ncbi:MAG: hypothetical protein ACE5DX_03250 [Candidatus Dojkabacteria bacterium]